MGQLYGGDAGNKLEAAKQAIQSTNQIVSGWGNGTKFGLITFRGGQNGVGSPPTYEVFTINQLAFRPFWGGLTNNLTSFNNKLTPLSPNGSTPTYDALDFSEGEMLADHIGSNLPVFILLTDGVPTISSERYSFDDASVQNVQIKNPNGTFRTAAQVRASGPEGPTGYHAGEPLADVMEEIVAIKAARPNYTYHAIGIQGQGSNTFNPEILEYVASIGGGIFAQSNNVDHLQNALEQAVNDTGCTTQAPATQMMDFDITVQEGDVEDEEDDAILVTWETNVEVDTLGFNLYRRVEEAEGRTSQGDDVPDGYEKVNDELIPSQAGLNGEGAYYEWLDQDIDSDLTYEYLLEEVKEEGAGEPEVYPEKEDEEAEEALPGHLIFLPLLSTD
jgi:hypothetical protein